jgi:endonuclease-3 related protein
MGRRTTRTNVRVIYQHLYKALGPQKWWPADSPFEVIIGAILTQNTSWKNVEKALGVLKRNKVLTPRKLYDIEEKRLAEAIRSSGFYNIKAKRIKHFIRFLFENYQGSLERMFLEDGGCLREKLMEVNGVGPETVDSILLYAGGKPFFVVDAYTKRILLRHDLISDNASYHDIQALFMDNLEKDVSMFNEYHALLVYVGKYFCKKIPSCEGCPLKRFKKKDTLGNMEKNTTTENTEYT